MKIETSRRHLFSLESVAMTDIVLNMFIFFFISFSLLYTFSPSAGKHIKVNLPKAKNVAKAEPGDRTVSVALSSDGPVYLEGSVVTLKELGSKLSAMRSRNPTLSVVVEVDRLVAFKNVVRVLDALNGAGIERLRIAAQEEK